jgi:hypothetical protein
MGIQSKGLKQKEYNKLVHRAVHNSNAPSETPVPGDQS